MSETTPTTQEDISEKELEAFRNHSAPLKLLITQEPEAPSPDLVALAVQNNADAAGLERVMLHVEHREERRARNGFFHALSRFQSLVPDIPQTKGVKNRDGSLRYKYAPLDVVLKTIRPALAECGLSVRWEPASEAEDEATTVICAVSHEAGHTERSSVRIPGIVGHGTNAAQDAAGGITYARRYSLLNALGLQADSDNDAQDIGGGLVEVLLRQSEALRGDNVLSIVQGVKTGLAEGGDVSVAAEAYAELSAVEVAALWVATSKGGIWTVAERKRIKNDAEFQEMVHAHRERSDWHKREQQ